MKHYDRELSIVFADHGLQQALALQAKTGRNKSKIVKCYDGEGIELVNTDGSVAKSEFTANKKIRINLIAHGGPGCEKVSDLEEGGRSWDPSELEDLVRQVIEFALPPARAAQMIQRLSMIVCYGGGHTYVTQNEYGAIINPKESFGYKFFDCAKGWLVDLTARGDISSTQPIVKAGTKAGSLNPDDYIRGYKMVGEDNARKDKYRKVRFYNNGGQVGVEWPYLGYD